MKLRTATQEFKDGRIGAAIAVRLTPRAKINQVGDFLEDGSIKIRITAPPVNGKANRALIKYLSNILGIPVSSVEIVAGDKGRNKIIGIYGLTIAEVNQKIMAAKSGNK
jgi:uncharacterized protein (TIGR00251 family)